MKKYCITVCLLLHITLYAQVQRLAILPTTAPLTVTKTKTIQLRSFCIDYFRKKPRYYTQYNTVIPGEQAGIDVTGADGKKVTITMEEALKGAQPVLKIYAVGRYAATFARVEVVLNPQRADIKSVTINTIQQSVMLAESPSDNDDLVARTIFKTYGQKINQQSFWQKALCIEVLKVNNRFTVDGSGKLDAATAKLVAVLEKELLLQDVEVNKLYSLLQKGEVTIKENGSLTEATVSLLKNLLHKQ